MSMQIDFDVQEKSLLLIDEIRERIKRNEVTLHFIAYETEEKDFAETPVPITNTKFRKMIKRMLKSADFQE